MLHFKLYSLNFHVLFYWDLITLAPTFIIQVVFATGKTYHKKNGVFLFGRDAYQRDMHV